MRPSVFPIINWASVNDFDIANQWIIRSQDANTLYFQLIDLDNNNLRYIPSLGSNPSPAKVIVTFKAIDNMNIVQITATQDPNDGSIWSFYISPTQKPNGGAVRFSLYEGPNLRTFSVPNLLCVEHANAGSDGHIEDFGTYDYNPSFGTD